ncbi:hypothetical protein CBR_g3820 [Chara braunii]|uniref:Uncharacterized protein n=1 Tax=Chara braunii TaxID=69332 RepID=A0A388KGE2_CHABU|nr:hypothetical protein CBR_g3820 [Chara braunii]|eukprot:GBG69122.1 hypothetical protein CBR_g3820 [Chara braunii]
MARLEDLQESRTKEALTIVSESYGLIERCLQSCKPKRSPDDENLRIEVKQLLPYFQKWDILGGHFNLSLAAILTIYTLQVHSTNVQAKGVGFSQSLTNMSATAMPI